MKRHFLWVQLYPLRSILSRPTSVKCWEITIFLPMGFVACLKHSDFHPTSNTKVHGVYFTEQNGREKDYFYPEGQFYLNGVSELWRCQLKSCLPSVTYNEWRLHLWCLSDGWWWWLLPETQPCFFLLQYSVCFAYTIQKRFSEVKALYFHKE